MYDLDGSPWPRCDPAVLWRRRRRGMGLLGGGGRFKKWKHVRCIPDESAAYFFDALVPSAFRQGNSALIIAFSSASENMAASLAIFQDPLGRTTEAVTRLKI
jgi:hypothetical protein